MKKNLRILLLIVLITLLGFVLYLIFKPSAKPKGNKAHIYQSYDFTNISDFFPDDKANQLVQYISINIAYDEPTEQALWVCYLLTKNHLDKPVCKRSNRFKSDPNIYSKSASTKDYYKSGYDRGHLAPAADMLWSEKAMQESFYMSNMSPQLPGFNRGVWKKLEGRVRKLAQIEDSLVILTGPLFLDSLGFIGENKVVIPSHYYKIIVDISSPSIGAVAFIIPNRNTKLSLDHFVVSIDSLEQISKINFMEPLPDGLEKQLETEYDKELLKSFGS